ncbi:exodeoxyribonuclease VII small subunit [Nocardioides sp. YIM 152588]|uniref:exodeoxyribonuclease VII small subunit n=1 Tax=Nocardioides sp. YIM 152588 TaxID=3158259 RepID=UPI0032E4E9CA
MSSSEETELSYEAARAELVEVVAALEGGGTTLEESLALWERGERLATICQDWLDGARERLDLVIAGDAATDDDADED